MWDPNTHCLADVTTEEVIIPASGADECNWDAFIPAVGLPAIPYLTNRDTGDEDDSQERGYGHAV